VQPMETHDWGEGHEVHHARLDEQVVHGYCEATQPGYPYGLLGHWFCKSHELSFGTTEQQKAETGDGEVYEP
jgi:hypothetical protein